jgi:hypothetical protein
MPSRSVSPFTFGRPVIEAIAQPLYDTIDILAAGLAPPYRWFTAPANKNPRQIHPDIIQGGTLSHPKIFVIWAFRLTTDEEDLTDTTIKFSNQLFHFLNIMWNSYYRLHVGVKDYLIVPTFAIPSGLGTTGYFDGVAAGEPIGWFQNNNNGFFGCQRSINNRRITIPPQQNFFAELQTVDNAVAPAADMEMWNFLEGEFGREVM